MPNQPLCTICKKPLPADPATHPFCSNRCRLIDLGNWLDGRYAIAGDERVGEPGVTDEDEQH